MKKAVYYISSSGAFLTMRDIESAFTVMTGKRREKNEGKYIRFLNMLFKKKKIVKYVTPTVEDLVRIGRIFNATMQYRREHEGCTVREAHEYVIKEIAEKMKNNNDKNVIAKTAPVVKAVREAQEHVIKEMDEIMKNNKEENE